MPMWCKQCGGWLTTVSVDGITRVQECDDCGETVETLIHAGP